ncbi:MAG: MBL fold metallo-hydrolase [Spirochaetaceae bacterium]|nr:MBL fold metallo-hydrolase [Spirochaetaceae bacterium]HPG26993.1 MBL fold metallo-hydrolase [Myxococcota bacterium]
MDRSEVPRVRFRLLFVLMAALLAVACGRTAMRVMSRAVESNLRADAVGALPDGLHVTLCGAGGPLPDPKRSAPCTAIVAGDRLFLVDAGSGAARNLAAVGYQAPRVDGVFLTHFHSDHIDGLGELALLRWTGGSHADKLPLYGPEGVAEIAEGLAHAYRLDSTYRVAHHGEATVPPSGSGYRAVSFAEPSEGEGTVVLDENGLRVTMFRVEHRPVSPAVGYRFDYAGRSVVLSGDTARSANLERFAAGADLLVHEALSPTLMGVVEEAAGRAGNETMRKIAHDVLDYHASPVDAARSAAAAEVGHLLFYHVVPPLPVPGLAGVYLDGVSEAYAGPVTLGRDGTAISLPAGSREIRVLED